MSVQERVGAPSQTSTSMGGREALILLVDDESDSRELLVALLEQVGHGVATAETGEEALRIAAERPPDLVVLDVNLPTIDGFETCRRLKQQHGPSLPVLMLSARGRAAAIQGLGAGADDYLPKPFDIDEFWARVEALLRIRAAEAAARRRAERLLSLQRVSAAFAARLDEAEVIERVLTEAQRLLDASGTFLWVWDPESALLRPARAIGPQAAEAVEPRRPGEGVVGQAFEHRRPIVVNAYDEWGTAIPNSRAAGIVAAAAAPLLLGDEVLGIISARKTAPGARMDDEDGQLLGLLAGQAAVALNNARLYAAQRDEAARTAERAAQLEAVMESIADGILLVDAGGRVTSANAAAVDLLGVPRASLVGAPVDRALPTLHTPDGQVIPRDELPPIAVLRSGAPSLRRELYVEVGGRGRILADTTAPIHDPSGAVTGAVSVLRDVTESRRTAELQAQADKLRALGQMASGVAHDVNNLLASVLGRAELARLELERGDLDDRRIAEALRLIEQAAEDGAQTVRRIQDFARVRRDGDVSVVDLGGLARDAVELTRPQWRDSARAAGRKIDVVLDVRPELFIAGQPAELREVLTNLLLNAVDAMPRGGTITITGRREGSTVCLDVADTGIGMSPTVRRRIFEPFFTTKGEAGNGLGLAVSYGIVQRRGGQISVESAPGRGTTFTLEFPAAQPPGRSAPTAAPPRPAARHVLVVDDEPALAAVLQRLLESEGHTVTTCNGGAEALERFDPEQHELVMTDLGMPDLNGLEVAAAIRARSPTTPVVLVTGWGSELDPERPPATISRILTKPYRLAQVLEALRGALGEQPPAPSPAPARNGSPTHAR